jgi:hypothetical protein
MKTYKCPRCGYSTNQKNDLRKHWRRKSSCQITLNDITIDDCFQTILNEEKSSDNQMTTFSQKSDNIFCCRDNKMTTFFSNINSSNNMHICIYCKKQFSHRNSKNVHLKKCKNRFFSEKDEIIESLKKQNEILQNEKNTLIQNTITTNNTTNNTVIINAFGKENLDYIKKEYIHRLIQEGPYGSIRKLIKYIHFNPDHKENHNIKIPNKRDKYAMVYDGSMWQIRNKKNMITTIADHAYGVIAEHCDDIISKKLDRFRDDFESEESRYMKKLAEDTELIILNGQKEIGLF